MMMLRLGNKIAVVILLLLFVPFVCQAQEGDDDEDELVTCIVCPDDLRVTNPQSIIQPPNQPPLTCADVQENGRRGLIRPQNVCAATKLAVPLLCGCGNPDDDDDEDGDTTMDPTTLEPTSSKPTSSPSFAPSSTPPPPPTATPVASIPDPSKSSSSIRSHSGDDGGADQSVDQSISPIDDQEAFGSSSSSYLVISSTVSMLVAVSFSVILW